ncbi:UNVERIFIED_CONTAM: hypothetical protein PYX00_010931 [Menopon gallinae]|uniref:Ribulose-phosphate 3-epimerase n=1 Tax=Menopon gallinae TaxID=328185 RepID=A0AAW2H6T7_9NEOP
MKRSIILAPSLLGANFLNLEKDLELLKLYKLNYLHLDVMDAHFVPNLSFGPSLIKELKEYLGEHFYFDTHLMIERPQDFLQDYVQAGANNLTFHFEAVTHHDRLIRLIHEKGLKASISLVPSSPVEWLFPLLPFVDMVLIMSVNPGFGGQSFLEYTAKKVETLRNYREKAQLNFCIQVDGGINSRTLPLMRQAGAEIFVAGSAFFCDEQEREKLVQLTDAF